VSNHPNHPLRRTLAIRCSRLWKLTLGSTIPMCAKGRYVTLNLMDESEPNPRQALTVVPADKPVRISRAVAAGIVVPAIIADAGDAAARRFLEFFAATIRNRNTRTAYLHAVTRFFAWCEHHQLGQLADIEPLHVAAYIEALGKDFEKPTVKQHLAAIRMLGRKARRRKIAR